MGPMMNISKSPEDEVKSCNPDGDPLGALVGLRWAVRQQVT